MWQPPSASSSAAGADAARSRPRPARDRSQRQEQGAALRAPKPSLMAESDAGSYAQIGVELGMTEGAVKVAVHRLRKRFRVLFQEEIARTLADPGDLQEEINELFLALSQ